MRLIAYTRVSTEDQAGQGHSLGQQPGRIRAWAEANGHTLVATVADEGVSASIPLLDRPGGAQMAAMLARGEADGIAAQRIDRLFRSARDGLAFAEDYAVRHRVALFVVDAAIDTSTPTGWLMLAMQLVTAQYERLMDVQRATETTRSLRESGRVYGHAPYGCVAHEGRLYRDPATWPTREWIVELRTEFGKSYREIRDTLFAQRVPSPAAGRWWPLSTLRTLCETHVDLLHLPCAEASGIATTPPVAEVSDA